MQQRTSELNEALLQQQATAAVLKTISRGGFDLQPVLESVVASAVRLCSADSGIVYRLDDGLLRLAATLNMSPEFREHVERNPIRAGRGTAAARALREGRTVHIPDIAADPDYNYPAAHTLGHIRAILGVPMLRQGQPVGVMTIWRSEPRAFSDRQIDLLTSFADQAAIAIENTRLLQALQARNRELGDSLEQQTATGEILRAISRSPIDVQPVFDAIVHAALKLCEARSACVHRLDGDRLDIAALAIVDPGGEEAIRGLYPRRADLSTVSGRAVLSRQLVEIPDVMDDADYGARGAAHRAGFRSMLGVPMLRDGRSIGAIVVGKPDPGPFPPHQVALLKTFADQAVIAIENARLFKELQARNTQLTEALAQQTATGEILRVISRSPTDVQPVFEAIAAAALALCRATATNVLTYDGKLLHLAARATALPESVDPTLAIFPRPAGTDTVAGQAILGRGIAVIPDVREGPEYFAQHVARLSGSRSLMSVPLMREGTPIGAISIGRPEAGRVPDQQIALLQTFADQAVIAIENVRLFNELHEKGLQLELASRHKSQFLANMSHELRTPLNAIIGFTRIVMRRTAGQIDPKQAENLDKILASGQHLLALINAILDLSKIEAGHVQVDARETELAPVLEQCLLTVEPLVAAEAVTLSAELERSLPPMLVDDEKLRQIVINLLSNAAKFTPSGRIVLSARASGEGVAIAVSDTGIGIEADKLQLVFEEFEQADASSTRVYGGTGLGLAIARRLARLMGGEIEARSRPGEGSTFTLSLPLRWRQPGSS